MKTWKQIFLILGKLFLVAPYRAFGTYTAFYFKTTSIYSYKGTDLDVKYSLITSSKPNYRQNMR